MLRLMPLPSGTRVVLRTDLVGEDGHAHPKASFAVVRSSAHQRLELATPSGRRLSASRDQVSVARKDDLEGLVKQDWSYRRLRSSVIYSAVVGSRAWGLADESSDEDVRGCFLLPFEDHASLFEPPSEVHDARHEEAFWEVEKLIRQALKGDANTLETLWSPLHKEMTPLGRELLEARELTRRVLCSSIPISTGASKPSVGSERRWPSSCGTSAPIP